MAEPGYFLDIFGEEETKPQRAQVEATEKVAPPKQPALEDTKVTDTKSIDIFGSGEPPSGQRDWGDYGEPTPSFFNKNKLHYYEQEGEFDPVKLERLKFSPEEIEARRKDHALRSEWMGALRQNIARDDEDPTFFNEMVDTLLYSPASMAGMAAYDPLKFSVALGAGAVGGKLVGAVGGLFSHIPFLSAPGALITGRVMGDIATAVGAAGAFTGAELGYDVALGKKDITLEEFGEAVGKSALLGGALGGVFGGASVALGALKTKAVPKTDIEVIGDTWFGQHPDGIERHQDYVKENHVTEYLKERRLELGISDMADEAGEISEVDLDRAMRGVPRERPEPSIPAIEGEPAVEPTWRDRIDPESNGFLLSELSDLYGVEVKDGLADFAQDRPIKTREGLQDAVHDSHEFFINKMDEMNPGFGSQDYLLGCFKKVDLLTNSFMKKYFSEVAKTADLDLASRNRMKKEIVRLTSKENQATLYETLKTGEDLPPEYSRELNEHVKALREAVQESLKTYHRQGLLVNVLEGWVPQGHDFAEISRHGKHRYCEDVRVLLDWDRMFGYLKDNPEKIKEMFPNAKTETPWLEPEIQMEVVGYVYDSMLETHGTYLSGGNGIYSANEHHRFFHFLNGEAHAAYNAKYGRSNSVMHAAYDHLISAARNQSMYEIMGPNPVAARKKLEDLISRNLDKSGRLNTKEATANRRSIEQWTQKLFERSSKSNYSSHGIFGNIVSLAKGLMLKNASIFSLIEEPMTRARKAQRMGGSYTKTLLKSIRQILPLTDKEVKREFAINNLYKTFMPDRTRFENPGFAEKTLRNLNGMLRKYVSWDHLSHIHEAGAALDFQAVLHDTIVERTWEEIHPEIKQHLQDAGVTAKDWGILKEKLKEFEEHNHVYHDAGIPEMAHESLPLLTTRKFLESLDDDTRALGFKIQMAEEAVVREAVIRGRTNSFSPYLTKPQGDVWGKIWEGLTQFRGYQFEGFQVIRAMVKRRQYFAEGGSNASKSQYGPRAAAAASFMADRLVAGISVELLRSLMKGEIPDYREKDNIARFLIHASFKSIPVSLLAETLLYLSYVPEKGWERAIRELPKSVGERTIIPFEFMRLPSLAMDYYGLMESIINEDNAKTIKYLYKVLPTDWYPIDALVNRMLLDPLLESAMPEGYAEFQDKRAESRANRGYMSFGEFLEGQ